MISFALIGFPKCGTTSILSNIGRCDSVYMIPGEPKPNELGFYSLPTSKKVGLKFPSAIYCLECGWEELFIMNRTKLIICWRDPYEHLLTFYNYRRAEIKNKVRWIQEFKKASPDAPLENVRLDHLIDNGLRFFDCSVENSKMEVHTRNAFERLRNNQILVINFDELRTNPRQFYSKICLFIGIPVVELPLSFTVENVNVEKDEVEELTEEQRRKLSVHFANTTRIMNEYTARSQQQLYKASLQK